MSVRVKSEAIDVAARGVDIPIASTRNTKAAHRTKVQRRGAPLARFTDVPYLCVVFIGFDGSTVPQVTRKVYYGNEPIGD